MTNSKSKILKVVIGILIGIFFLYLSFCKVDFHEMWQAFKTANYWYFIPAILMVFLSHILRALRWRYLIDPIRRLDLSSLFSSLIIGYAANAFMPAHLGEFLRAYVLGKTRRISMGQVFATIVLERIIDVFSLLFLTLLALFIYPFPDWVINSAYIMLAGTVFLLIVLILLKKASLSTMRFIDKILGPFPDALAEKVKAVLERFIKGIVPLKRWHDYIMVSMLSLLIWLCYGIVFHLCLEAFDFVGPFSLEWSASLILLVITTIAVVVPSSPGYVGTYHYLCQITLALFGVPAGPALSFATVVHGVNFIPVMVVGFFFAQHEGMAILKMSSEVSDIEKGNV